MAVFPNFKLTNNGVNLLNRVIAEKKVLKFTKFEIGEGDYQGDIKTLSQLVTKIKDFPVTETNVLSGGETNIKGYFDNTGVNSDKKLKEIGVFAQIGDEQLTEVLFSYTNCGDTADTIPSQSKNFFSRTLSVINKTSDAKDITFSVKLEYKKMDFNTVAELKLASWLSNGDKINLWGNETLGDVKKTSKIITTENTGIKLNNGLYAKSYTSFMQDGGYDGTGQDLKNTIDGKVDEKLIAREGEKNLSNLKGKIPKIGTDGITELGSAIDLHTGDGADYAIRLGVKIEGNLLTRNGYTVIDSSDFDLELPIIQTPTTLKDYFFEQRTKGTDTLKGIYGKRRDFTDLPEEFALDDSVEIRILNNSKSYGKVISVNNNHTSYLGFQWNQSTNFRFEKVSSMAMSNEDNYKGVVKDMNSRLMIIWGLTPDKWPERFFINFPFSFSTVPCVTTNTVETDVGETQTAQATNVQKNGFYCYNRWNNGHYPRKFMWIAIGRF